MVASALSATPMSPDRRDARGCSRLLQAKLLSSSQQRDRFANAPGTRFPPFGYMNPNDEVTSVGGRQLPKDFHALGFAFSALAM